ncbi:hypothetical protein Pst134EB_018526 [Puccinia striiformis f. sp. tritici]|nr:hypothetical protein Pst134EB_018526 [Puccinia striiformis f. sp. tritici]
MATSSNEDNPTRTSTTVLGQHPSNVSCRPHFPACQVHVDLLFKLYRRVGSEAIIRTYRNPTDCIITLDPSRISFESFKELVILRIGHAHHDLDTVIRADLELGTPTMRWSVGISNNEAALFRKPAFMPTSHDQIFQQWIWSINITQQGRPHVSIMQDMLDAAYEEHGATQSRSVSPSGNNNPPMMWIHNVAEYEKVMCWRDWPPDDQTSPLPRLWHTEISTLKAILAPRSQSR